MSVELRHLRAFVAVAEELNFTRAAARLHVVQQALSTTIRQLEERVGTQLVERSTRHVALTPAGVAFLEHARGVLASADEAVAAALDAAGRVEGRLRLGLLATAPLDFTPRVLRAHAAAQPGVRIEVRSVTFDDNSGGVRSGDADVALVWLPFDTRGLEVEPLFDDDVVAMLAADHPLAAQEAVDPAALAREPHVMVEGADRPTWEFWTLAYLRDGAPPVVGAQTTGFEDIFAAVRAGQAVAVVPASVASQLTWGDVAIRPLPGARPASVALCWREATPLVDAFCETARVVARSG